MIPDRSIVIVVMEIESWYFAKLPDTFLNKVGIGFSLFTTDTLTKEEFNRLIQQRMSRIEFMNEYLKHFTVDVEIERNASFRNFVQHWIEGKD